MSREERRRTEKRREEREKKEREKKRKERERKKWQSIAVFSFLSLSRIMGMKMSKVRSVCLKAVHHIFLLSFSSLFYSFFI